MSFCIIIESNSQKLFSLLFCACLWWCQVNTIYKYTKETNKQSLTNRHKSWWQKIRSYLKERREYQPTWDEFEIWKFPLNERLIRKPPPPDLISSAGQKVFLSLGLNKAIIRRPLIVSQTSATKKKTVTCILQLPLWICDIFFLI